MRIQRLHKNTKQGFSLLEMVLSMSILTLLTGVLVETTESMHNLAVSSGDQATLQSAGDKALLSIIAELRTSGTVGVGALSYPHIFEGGQPGAGFEAHEHEPAEGDAVDGDVDFGVDKEIVFLTPRDLDGDRRPDIGADGQLIWAAEEKSFVVNTRADGVNYLELRSDAGAPQMLTRHVERLVIDDSESSGFEIPLDSVRVRLFLRRRDSQGNVIRYSNEAVVALKNT